MYKLLQTKNHFLLFFVFCKNELIHYLHSQLLQLQVSLMKYLHFPLQIKLWRQFAFTFILMMNASPISEVTNQWLFEYFHHWGTFVPDISQTIIMSVNTGDWVMRNQFKLQQAATYEELAVNTGVTLVRWYWNCPGLIICFLPSQFYLGFPSSALRQSQDTASHQLLLHCIVLQFPGF